MSQVILAEEEEGGSWKIKEGSGADN